MNWLLIVKSFFKLNYVNCLMFKFLSSLFAFWCIVYVYSYFSVFCGIDCHQLILIIRISALRFFLFIYLFADLNRHV